MKYPSLTFEDFLFTFVWLFVLILIANIIRQKNQSDIRYRYYLPHFYYMVCIGSGMALFYIYKYGGGDTTAYWKGANILNNVCYKSPVDYFGQLISTPEKGLIPSCYDSETGIPPLWIYNESSSWFVCKIASVFSFFCFNSYLALNLIFVTISTIISWRFFLFIDNLNQIETKYNAIATLFIPTVCFWCSGLMKDTIVYWSILILVMQLFKILNTSKINIKTLLICLISVYVIISTRSFVLIGIFVPYFLIIIFRMNSTKPFITRLMTRIAGITIALAGLTLFLRSSEALGEFSAENLLTTAESIHSDFSGNQTYTGKRYDLGIEDFNTASLIRVFPLTVITTLVRPFIWEVESPIMVMNALEGSVFIYFSFKLFKRRKNRRVHEAVKTIQESNFFWFCLLFILIMSFFIGLTSGLFGVLARLKAPILPFFLLLLFSKIDVPNKERSVETYE